MLESHFPNYTNRNSILELNANIPHFIYIYIHTHTCIYVCVCIYIYIKWGMLAFSSRMLFLFV